MNVLLVSQCSKRALIETRRILDQFAERRGDRTWQTAITMDGLGTLRKLLRKTARKNTAVACHWIRGKDHSELMWIVGDAGQFNTQGTVPTNTTERDILRSGDENNWHTLEAIKSFSQLAALLHDLGKASVAFQERLAGKRQEKNLFRHEWVSLRLFAAFVGQDDDESWLMRLAAPEAYTEQDWIAQGRYQCDGINAVNVTPFAALPPLAKAIGWLVVTHHRLPVIPVMDEGIQRRLGVRANEFSWAHLEGPLNGIDHRWNEVFRPAELAERKAYWELADTLPVMHKIWRKQAARLAKRLLEIQRQHKGEWVDNPYLMHLSRLCLMLSDHHYSSLGLEPDGTPVKERQPFLVKDGKLYANTTSHNRFNQTLTEHLLGVANGAGAIAHALPGFERYLPRLANHRGLRKRSGKSRFAWQDKAFDATVTLRERARERGAFIINMASTGCGKTLANARILYALSDPQLGMRATYALGLRTLTLQTGRSYRNDLHLDEDELAILVGGSASRALFEYYETQAEQTGSASVQALIEEDSHVLYEGASADHPLLARAMANVDIRKLLSAPMLVCTVDHLVPATESQRAGRQIAPMLRLMSSDLILDELDDYDLNDLPALARLVHWAGLLGSRVILSSATLPPALLEGMFMAYRAGRKQYEKNRNANGDPATEALDIPCLWVDEFNTQQADIAELGNFAEQHQQFVSHRVKKLSQAEPLRRAEILPLTIQTQEREQIYKAFAKEIREGCLRLHHAHAESDPVTGKRVSFGIVRMANIEPLVEVAKLFYSMDVPEDTHIHICVYHSRFPLVQRSAIENLLDNTFNRRDEKGQAVYHRQEIRELLDARPAQHQIFIVLASPVCEVGRDWDADWALVEPSSMRGLIQLAGRVQRHRCKVPAEPNLLLLDAPINYFLQCRQGDAVYQRPGFEKGSVGGAFYLSSHWLHDLLRPEEYRVLSAIPRISPRPENERNQQGNLVDLEHARMTATMYPRSPQTASSRRSVVSRGLERDEAAPVWQYANSMLTAVLPQQQPFRDSSGIRTDTLVFRPDDDEETLLLYRVEDDPSARGQKLYVLVDVSKRHDLPLQPAFGVSPWVNVDLMSLLREQAEAMDIPLDACAQKMATAEVLQSEQGWYWHPWLGFIKKN
jgi:CRISPR-associated endonuclease/helicase Cas3